MPRIVPTGRCPSTRSRSAMAEQLSYHVSMLKIAVLDDYHKVSLSLGPWNRLDGLAEIVAYTEHLGSTSMVISELQKFDVLVVMRERTPLDQQCLENLPNLKLIVTTGMENRSIDMAYARSKGIPVSGTRGGLSNAVELTWGLILSHLRNINTEDSNIRNGRWQTTIGRDLYDKTIGLVGLGRTGIRMARVALAFDMRVLAWSPHLTPEAAESTGARYASKEELFLESDIVSVHLQLSDSTKGIIGTEDFSRMKKSALFVNTSRAALVDQSALESAVRNNVIAGAALDVFATEPLPIDDPIRQLPNSVLTPHIGYVTEGLYTRFFTQIVENIESFLEGSPTRVLNASIA